MLSIFLEWKVKNLEGDENSKQDDDSLQPLILRGSSVESEDESLVWINEDSDEESIDSFPTFSILLVRPNNTDTDDLSFATVAADTCEETEHEWDFDSDEKSERLIEIEKKICMKTMTVPNTVHILNAPNIFRHQRWPIGYGHEITYW